MIKVSVIYAHSDDATFDHDYYRDKHLPMIKELMGDNCLYYTIDKGIAGGAPGSAAPFIAICHIFCESLEKFQAGFGPNAKSISADVANYTNIAPVIQISDVVVDRP